MIENPYQPPDSFDNGREDAKPPLIAYVFSTLAFLAIFLLVSTTFYLLAGVSLVPVQLMRTVIASGFIVAAALGVIVAWRTWRRFMRAHEGRLQFEANRQALLDEYGPPRK